MIVVVSLGPLPSKFHLHGSLPSPSINAADEDDSSTRTVTRDALRRRCVPVRTSPETNTHNIADISGD